MAGKKQEAVAETKLVIATRAGYYGQYREPGDEFEVPAGLNAKWFVDAKPVAKPAESEAGDLV